MAATRTRASKKAGLPPGTLVHIGAERTEPVAISYMDYDAAQLSEKRVEAVEECFPFKETPTVTWINVDGIHEVGIIETIGRHFDIHPLVLEDIVSTRQRPKLEDYPGYLYLVLKMLYHGQEGNEVQVEQVSLILGKNFLISFQERPGDVFDALRQRLRAKKGRVRDMGADYLAYALIDAIVDNYFAILEHLGDEVEELEDLQVSAPSPETLREIHRLKRQMVVLRRSIYPLREVAASLGRGEITLIGQETLPYFRDIYDHAVQVIDQIETFRDVVSGMLDIYLSSISNRMNEVMKVLTVFASIFIPLTFLAGVYGMNFEHIPELHWKWAYPLFWIAAIVLGGGMLLAFKRKKWL